MMRAQTRSRRPVAGFSLIEIAVALFIITLLVGSILVPLTTQVEQRQISETERTLEEIREALIGYAVAKGNLPCPDRTSGGAGSANDTANDGIEDYNTGTGICFSTTQPGNVPWVTLGLTSAASDVWGNRFRYRVDTDFANRSPAANTPFSLTTAADLSVCSITTCTTRLTSATAGEGAVVVIASLGRNGRGAISAQTGASNPAPPAGTDENQNLDGTVYVSRTYTGAVSPCSDTVAGQPRCEFDDILTWLSKYTLFHRMVAAGKLP